MPIAHPPSVRSAARLVALWLICAGKLAAQGGDSGSPPRIVAVRVVTAAGQVLENDPSDLSVKSGEPYTTRAASAGLRELYRTGRFADIRAELADVPGGVRLDFVVLQNMYVNRVGIEGLHEPPSEALALSSLRLNL